jgi:RAB protein geranylgeranyltransferase component A
VSKYVSFRILDSVSVWQQTEDGEGKVRRVPGSKEQVFKDKDISLMEKRRLMKFLMFAAGEFEDDVLLKGTSCRLSMAWTDEQAKRKKRFLPSYKSLSPYLRTSLLRWLMLLLIARLLVIRLWRL